MVNNNQSKIPTKHATYLRQVTAQKRSQQDQPVPTLSKHTTGDKNKKKQAADDAFRMGMLDWFLTF